MKTTDPWLSRTTLILVVVGLLVSVYMTIYKFTENDSMCLGSVDCATVNASRYSEVNGIPVAVIGALGYGAILAALLFESRSAFLRQNGSLLVFCMSLAGFLITVWLIYVEIALIKALCPFCIVSQTVMTIVFILSIVRLIRESKS